MSTIPIKAIKTTHSTRAAPFWPNQVAPRFLLGFMGFMVFPLFTR
jgi:hypothetical protein